MTKEKDKDRENHQGSVVAEDEDFTEWLNILWARGEPPERLELHQVFGKYKAVRGEMIFHQDFKPNDKADVEQVNKIANEILAAAQNDTDTLGKESTYQLVVIDRNRKAQPLVRRIGPIVPKRKVTLANAGVAGLVSSEEEDGEELDARSLNWRYAQANLEQLRWEKQRHDQGIAAMLTLAFHKAEKSDERSEKLINRLFEVFDKLQEAQDRSLDRELLREREKMKNDLLRDGMRLGRNLLPGLFAAAKEETTDDGSGNGQNGNGKPKHGPSHERTLVQNFLHDCVQTNIDAKLFGDYKENNEGVAELVTPGIFSVQQYSTLYGVSDGRLPPEALDNLMPDSGHRDAVTEEQILKARKAGVTDGIGMALFEIMALRKRAQEVAASRSSSKKSTNQEENQQ